jgi:hypothetical protein
MTDIFTDTINLACAIGGVLGVAYTAYQIGKGKSCYVKISDCKELHESIQDEIKKEVDLVIEKVLTESNKRELEDVKLHEKIDSVNIKVATIEGKISKRNAS